MINMDKGVTNMNLINMDAFPVEVPPKIKQGAAAEEIAFSIGESVSARYWLHAARTASARSSSGPKLQSWKAILQGDLPTASLSSD
jgi:hypothetical protein